MKEKRYEAAYAGFVYEAPATHWTPSTVVRQRLTKMDFTKPDGIELGGMPIISDGQTAFVDAADGHTAVLACSGMKKSICGFMPLIVSLAQAGENLIVTDPKGELYDRTAGLLQHRGYQVYCLNFRSMDKDCFNILSYAAEVYRNGDQNKGLSLLSDIVNALAEEQRQRAKDNFWPDTAALWLNGTGAVMLDAFPDIKQVNVLNWSDFNVWSSAQIVEEHLLKKMPDNTAKAALRQCLSSPENTFRSILITASSFFGMFNQNPKLAAMLSHSTFTLGDLTNPKDWLIFDHWTLLEDGMVVMRDAPSPDTPENPSSTPTPTPEQPASTPTPTPTPVTNLPQTGDIPWLPAVLLGTAVVAAMGLMLIRKWKHAGGQNSQSKEK